MHVFLIFVIGIITGILPGLFGIGGGIILVPLLIYLMGFPTATASGTSLVALLMPVGILGVIEYFKAGKISWEHVRFGFIVALGIFLGTFFGAKLAVTLPESQMKKTLAVFLSLVAVKFWVSS